MDPAGAHQPPPKRRRISSSAADMQSTITHPGTIKINVSDAYIVDNDISDPDSQSANSNSPNDAPEEADYEHDKRSLRLPNHTSTVSHVAVDIGGSLAKVVYFSREEEGGRLNFLKFETDKVDVLIEFMRELQTQHKETNGERRRELCIMATGGGAYKYYDRIKSELGVDVVREDEMECLIVGLDFFITEIPNEVFTYNDTDLQNPMRFAPTQASAYPYLLVNIGSGVSMIKVSAPSTNPKPGVRPGTPNYQRIGGTSLGGGTFWGLLSLLTGAGSFDEMLAMAEQGDNSSVDLLVGDIYGTGMGYEKIGLSERTIASSFGKVFKRKREAEREAEDGGGLTNGEAARVQKQHTNGEAGKGGSAQSLVGDGRMFKVEDISRSLLYAISNNIGQIAYLQSEKHDLQHIYFGGSFIRGYRQTIHTLAYAIKFWSKGSKQAYFLRHEGYLGAVGAFLRRQPSGWGRRGSVDGI
ncbi:hypothetical protein LTR66_009591 [Elasticomyces elasticus]|nr:hypothetical protein LTR66_009591 [Elasticomyces elasticus]